ncbi:E3 ubiquitin-protein ligase Siah1-like [Bacillus rossius redtenbacheri]|uniref:E3 ubiquitin-protein ligase Siah1-like n=1 Tax=Bacillus rossius redtenbacheri TaxID=93214 RepID=UPI002FDC9F80
MLATGRRAKMSKPGDSASPPQQQQQQQASPTAFDDINDGLVRLLECPVCADPMTDKIYMCRNGHNVCAACRPRLGASCPTCRGELMETRCLLAETIARKLLYPCDHGCGLRLSLRERRRHEERCPLRLRECANRARGCPRRLPPDGKREHEASCPYRRYECPRAPQGCDLEVLHKDRRRHDASCPYRAASCAHCEASLLHKDKQAHEQACPLRLVPCEHAEAGCKERLVFRDRADHEASCAHRLYDCVPCRPDGCRWRGRRSALEKHMAEDHRIAVWRSKSNLGVWCDYDSCTDRKYAGLVSVYGELFWYRHRFEARRGTCSWTVQYVGARDGCARFRYRLAVYADEKAGPSVTFDDVPVASDLDPVDEVFESRHGVCLDARMLEKYVVDNSMRIKFKIKKVK